jgi:hypothetical protein
MDGMSPEPNPVDAKAGLSPSRERRWGLIGGTVGPIVGIGAAVTAIAIDGVPWYTSGPYPLVFTEHRLLALDVYIMIVFLAGLGFSTKGLIDARQSPYPRTDAFGAGLMGAILMGVSGFVAFIRLIALIQP